MELSQPVKDFAEQQNWNIEESRSYGEYNGYLFTVTEGVACKVIGTILFNSNEDSKEKIGKFIKKNKKELQVKEFNIDDWSLIVKLREPFFGKFKKDIINIFLDRLTSFLKEIGVSGRDKCIYCNEGGSLEKIFINGICVAMHDNCYEELMKDLENEKKDYKEETKNYGKGFLGGVLGGIIYSIPMIITQLFFNINIGIIFSILIGRGALRGYKYLKGKLGRGTKWIIGLGTFTSFIISQIIVILSLFISRGMPVTIEALNRFLSISNNADIFFTNVFRGIVIIILSTIHLMLNLKGNSNTVFPRLDR